MAESTRCAFLPTLIRTFSHRTICLKLIIHLIASNLWIILENKITETDPFIGDFPTLRTASHLLLSLLIIILIHNVIYKTLLLLIEVLLN